MERSATIFNEIRTCFFPRWDIKKEWTIEIGTRTPSQRGFCDSSNKAICVYPLWAEESDGDLYALIIHEICHAVASPWHGKTFQARLLEAADKAQDMGKTDLADKLRLEVKSVRESVRLTAHNIYCQIADAVFDVPDASMDAIFAWIADSIGYTVQELLKRYPKAEKVYDTAKEEIASYKATEARFEKLRGR